MCFRCIIDSCNCLGSLANCVRIRATKFWSISVRFDGVCNGLRNTDDVVLDLIVSFGFIYEPFPGVGFGMVVNDGVDVPTVNINFGMLAFSAIMYSLSAIFRYAALLQQLSDETV